MELLNMQLEKMLATQAKLNDEFVNQEVTRVIDEPLPVFTERKVTGVSRTEIVELGNGAVELKRFIDRKLYKMVFTKGLTISGVIKWFEVQDELFIKCSF